MELKHSGVAHDENPPGRGSGRYPWGSKNNVAKKIKSGEVFEQSIKRGKDKPNISPAEKIISDSKSAINAGADISRHISKLSKRNQGSDYSELSDSELRAIINRIQMEQQLSRLEAGDQKSGAEIAGEVLSIAGDVLGIVGAGAGIAAVVYNLAKG